VSTNVSISDSATELAPNKDSAKPKPVSKSIPTTIPTRSDQSASPLVQAEILDVTELPVPIEVAFEEEHINKKDFPRISHLSLADTPLLSNTTLTIPRPETPPQIAQTLVPDQLSPTHWLQQAQQLIQAEKYEEAHVVLDPLFKDPPVNWEPWFWMGTALLGQSHFEQADQFFLSGLARNDKIPQLWIQRALVAQQRGEYQLAIHELRRAESLDATLPHVHLNMGYAYEKLGNERLAHEYYVKFLKLSEGNPAFFSIRKKLYARFTEQVQSTPHPGLSSSLPENP
jgi:tetratricopeptide (TPR) repeat protein